MLKIRQIQIQHGKCTFMILFAGILRIRKGNDNTNWCTKKHENMNKIGLYYSLSKKFSPSKMLTLAHAPYNMKYYTGTFNLKK